MINVYIPAELYRALSLYTTFNPNKDINSFKNEANGRTIYVYRMSDSFFEDLNKSQPVIDALVKDSKLREREELQEQIERAAYQHRKLLEQLDELDRVGGVKYENI